LSTFFTPSILPRTPLSHTLSAAPPSPCTSFAIFPSPSLAEHAHCEELESLEKERKRERVEED
jgi:hypothetical protein